MSRSTHYILKDGAPVPATLHEWAQWYETADAERVVENTQWGDVRVSTVFLGLDHRYGDGPPQIYETMVFGGSLDQEGQRYATEEEARRGHAEMLDRVKVLASPESCRDCGTTKGVTLAPDPYDSEIYGDETPVRLCEDCRYNRAMEV